MKMLSLVRGVVKSPGCISVAHHAARSSPGGWNRAVFHLPSVGVLTANRNFARSDSRLTKLLAAAAKHPDDINSMRRMFTELHKSEKYSLLKRTFEENPTAQRDSQCYDKYVHAMAALGKLDQAIPFQFPENDIDEAEHTPRNQRRNDRNSDDPAPTVFSFTQPVPVRIETSWFERVSPLIGRLLTLGFLGGLLYLFTQGSSVKSPADVMNMGAAHHRADKTPSVGFDDVKGIDETKEEVQDIVEYLRNPGKFQKIGAEMPKGVLLSGPPGTGKTLLAKAIAGEAGVPFFFASGSGFDEMFVGVGSSRVRQLFVEARKNAPCIVFIDEIDGVGMSRKHAMHYKDNTLAQLLTEMDGFEPNSGVVVIGATNMPQWLDEALVRPGRFDKHLSVPLPDIKGREQILQLYVDKIKTDGNIDILRLARSTTGLTGADLQNMVNSAAIKAVNRGDSVVTTKIMEEAFDDLMMGGKERRSVRMSEESKKMTAYHEGGHALVACLVEGANQIRKATIVPRGKALGYVSQMQDPSRQFSLNRQQMEAQLAICMGGRIAEELIFGVDQVSSGASSDLEKATNIATDMVERWGMSGTVGPRAFNPQNRDKLSEETKALMEKETQRILQEQYDKAYKILKAKERELHKLAAALLEYETLDGEEIKTILNGGEIRK